MPLGSEPILSWGLPPEVTAAMVVLVTITALLLLSYLVGVVGSRIMRWRRERRRNV
jgi:hypothetical protein